MQNKKGFTLPEVMVTLGVLGILAAILVPAITKSAPDSKKVMFKKAYSTLETAVSELINDDVNYPATAKDVLEGTSISVQVGLHYQDVTGVVPSDANKFCYLLSQVMNTVGTVKCATADTPKTFMTSDGILWSTRYKNESNNFPLKMDSTNDAVLLIDVNGSKGPNCGAAGNLYKTATCAANITADQYEIGVRFDGKLIVYDTNAVTILEDPLKISK